MLYFSSNDTVFITIYPLMDDYDFEKLVSWMIFKNDEFRRKILAWLLG